MVEKKENKTKKKGNKFLSIKAWVCFWAMILITYIVVFNRIEFYNIAWTLCSVPLAYIGANVAEKNIFSKQKIEESKIESSME